MRGGEWVFAAVCAAWWLAALVGQSVTPRVTRWRRRDFLYLLPAYRFFAPTPEFRDRTLEYRLEQADATVGPWMEVTFQAPRGGTALLWYPHKMEPLFVELNAARLIELTAASGPEATTTTRAYTALLRYVRDQAPKEAHAAMQFQVRTAQGYDSGAAAVPVYRSPWNRPAS